jgi:hypothetical protein
LDKRGSELLFQVITKRYERGSIIITTNIAFKGWPRIFAGDATMTSALLDRLLHHAQPIIIERDSYRSAKRKAQIAPTRSRRSHRNQSNFKSVESVHFHAGARTSRTFSHLTVNKL